ncbi:hypothetical protein [Gloeocapsopsis dulcis]|uniref:Uncharacterized protein n=1 Tax=Gloeocapsopsis dulcis AAB1 = 1H9 TaxID=1433147 RepID=A0A6N8FUE7_9CHRO|nr:hypothetical protein [Gloeocapsopsis dulcis]MUL36394.1 hypothetical protein [Gloeocapsopsis dulcis AAB1 = 1H9]WNN88111.1 hypothetical protein P0S91_17660 [Gloeocapsopsis dulcis]
MDSENQQRYQTAIALACLPIDNVYLSGCRDQCTTRNDSGDHSASEILKLLRSGQVLMVNSRRRNGLILYKGFHAEFAGPGAAVGSFYDRDCDWALPVGNLSLLTPESHEERQKAYLIRRQWIRLMKQITEKSQPQQRVQKILEQFEQYFDSQTVSQIPNEAFARLIGVLPQTANIARSVASSIEEV